MSLLCALILCGTGLALLPPIPFSQHISVRREPYTHVMYQQWYIRIEIIFGFGPKTPYQHLTDRTVHGK